MFAFNQKTEQAHKIIKPHTEKSREVMVKPATIPRNQFSLSTASGILNLQRTVGNQAVIQMLRERETNLQALSEEEELPCPGSGIRSGGQGRMEGVGQGRGPIGLPYEEKRW